jgi:hypothetical protein
MELFSHFLQKLNKLSFSAGSAGRAWWLILAIALMIMGGALLWDTYNRITLKQKSSTQWLSAGCRVNNTHVHETSREHVVGRGAKIRRYYYRPEATCTYEISDASVSPDDSTFTHTISIDEEFSGFSGRQKAETWLEEHYSIGMLLIIYYDPDYPQQAVLQLETRSWTQTMLVGLAGCILLGFGGVMVVAYFVAPRQHNAHD